MANLTHSPKNISEAIKALNGRKARKIGNNTELHDLGHMVVATLHGHEIVRYTEDMTQASWAGYATSTTRDRLNQLTTARFNIKQGEPHMNGQIMSASGWYDMRDTKF